MVPASTVRLTLPGTVPPMCCFSGRVREVSRTRIFARATEAGRQLLAYSMTVVADDEVAMILPLPTPVGVVEDAVQFIDLSGYPELFRAIDDAFPQYLAAAPAAAPASRSFQPQTLVVHQVGQFEASFVPTVADFDRLDARFRLPDAVWDQRPEYLESSFAVFQLRGGTIPPADPPGVFARVARAARDVLPGASAGVHGEIHPMAFAFPRRDPSRLFFPTVHVHDGVLTETAAFDHQLYWQGGPLIGSHHAWELEAAAPADLVRAVDIERAMGLVDPAQGCWRWTIAGDRPNTDTYVDDPQTVGVA